MTQETSKIYVDLDSLLDTRQGTILKFDIPEDTVLEYLASEKYCYRERDSFELIDDEAYKKEYEKRDLDTLKLSTVTYILYLLAKKIDNLEKRSAFMNEKKVSEVVINAYPYLLNEEQITLLKDMLFTRLKVETFISVINLPPSEVTPFFVKSNGFITCFIYDFAKWVEASGESLDEIRLNNTIFYFPGIHEGVNDDEVKKGVEAVGFKDVFAYTEYLFSPVTNISFLPALFYNNIKVAEVYMDKYEKEFASTDLSKHRVLSEEEMEEFLKEKVNGDSSTEIPVS